MPCVCMLPKDVSIVNPLIENFDLVTIMFSYIRLGNFFMGKP